MPTHDVFTNEVISAFKQALTHVSQSGPQPVEMQDQEVISLLSQPPEFSLGQIAIPCHTLAKKLRLPPQKIAEALTQAMKAYSSQYISEIQAVAGYVNFHCNLETYGLLLLKEVESGSFFQKDILPTDKKEKIVVEFSQPNTHKALHVGHLRNMVYGDAVCHLLEYIGHKIDRATYPGDLGAHIAKSLWYIKTQKNGQLPSESQADCRCQAEPPSLCMTFDSALRALVIVGSMFVLFRVS